MNLNGIFSKSILEQAQMLVRNKNVTILNKTTHEIDAVVFDRHFYRVTVRFRRNYDDVDMFITSDGKNSLCPYSTPYAAALLYKLFAYEEFNLSCNLPLCQDDLHQITGFRNMSVEYLRQSNCYYRVSSTLVNHILELQNHNTDAEVLSFSNCLEDLFVYFDSLENAPKEQLVAIQLFMRFYSQLEFRFKTLHDIHYLILDECNTRINDIIESIPDPIVKSFYQMIIHSDEDIQPYLCDYNKKYYPTN